MENFPKWPTPFKFMNAVPHLKRQDPCQKEKRKLLSSDIIKQPKYVPNLKFLANNLNQRKRIIFILFDIRIRR